MIRFRPLIVYEFADGRKMLLAGDADLAFAKALGHESGPCYIVHGLDDQPERIAEIRERLIEADEQAYL